MCHHTHCLKLFCVLGQNTWRRVRYKENRFIWLMDLVARKVQIWHLVRVFARMHHILVKKWKGKRVCAGRTKHTGNITL